MGGFDEHIPFPGGEDPGLSFKIHGQGYIVKYHSEAMVYHDFEPSIVDFAQKFYRYGAGNRDQIERHLTPDIIQKWLK